MIKTFLITGSSGALGSALVNKILKENKYHRIIGISRRDTDKRIKHIKLDLSDIRSIEPQLRLKLNGEKIDYLINCAGSCESKEFIDRSPLSIYNQINTNLTSTLVLTRVAMDYLNPKSSHIINISSLMGRIPNKFYTVYSSTKFALVGFSESLRLETGDKNIKVSCVLPSLFESKMTQGAKVIPIIKPHKAETIADEVYKLLGRHEGLRTIGLISSLSCVIEKFLPVVNRFISKTVI